MTFTKDDTGTSATSGNSVSIPINGRVFATAFSKGYQFGNNPMLALGMKSSIIVLLTNFQRDDQGSRVEKVDVEIWREVNHGCRVQCMDWPYPPSAMLPITDLIMIATGGSDGKVRVFRLRSSSEENDEVRTVYSHSDYVNSVAFQPQGNILASGSDDCTVVLTDLESNELHTMSYHSPVMSVGWHPEEEAKLMIGEKSGHIHIFNVENLRPIMSFDYMNGPLMTADWSLRNSLYVSAAVGSELLIWDLSAPSKPMMTNSMHEDIIRHVKFSPLSDTLIATSGQPKYSVKVLNAKSSQVVFSVNDGPVGGISWHPKLDCLAIGGDEKLTLYFPTSI